MNKHKLTPKLVADLVKLATTGLVTAMYTDRELFEKMNEALPEGLKICYRTFQRYKATALHYGDLEVEQSGKFDSVYTELLDQLQLAALRQKENLINKMLEVEGNKWHRYKWLLEKKFPEFNQGCIMEKFRRENSYQNDDYPMYQPRKHYQQPAAVAEQAKQPQQILPTAPQESKAAAAQPRSAHAPAAKPKNVFSPNDMTLHTPLLSTQLSNSVLPNQRKQVPSLKHAV